MLGGGKAMMNAYYETALKLGVEMAYESEVRELNIRDGEFASALAIAAAARRRYARKSDGRRIRRIRGEHRVAERVLGRSGGQLHHSRHAATTRAGC